MKDNNILENYMLPDRARRLREVLDRRTSSITVVVENFHKEHNVDAVLRSCEAFGVQHVHIIPEPGEGGVFRTITMGCEKWLTVHYHPSFQSCFRVLKEEGFRVLAGSLGEGAVPLQETDFSGRVALVFSNELEGASDAVLEAVDGLFVIPLFGFSQSLNVSVAAGITLHHARSIQGGAGASADGLPEPEKERLLDDWSRKAVKFADEIVEEHRRRK